MSVQSPSLLITTRHFRGLSGKVILINNNIPALVKAGWRILLIAEELDEDMTHRLRLGAKPHKIWGRGMNKHHKLTRFIKQAERFARMQNVEL